MRRRKGRHYPRNVNKADSTWSAADMRRKLSEVREMVAKLRVAVADNEGVRAEIRLQEQAFRKKYDEYALEVRAISENAEAHQDILSRWLGFSTILSPGAQKRMDELHSQIGASRSEMGKAIYDLEYSKLSKLPDVLSMFGLGEHSDWLRLARMPESEHIEAGLKEIGRLQKLLLSAEKREARAAAKARARERTEAAAAAHFQETRAHAEKHRNDIRRQAEIFPGCPYCGGPLGHEPHMDHIYPVTRGGLSNPENMAFICAPCNLKKSDKTLREFILSIGLDRAEVESRLEKLGKRF